MLLIVLQGLVVGAVVGLCMWGALYLLHRQLDRRPFRRPFRNTPAITDNRLRIVRLKEDNRK